MTQFNPVSTGYTQYPASSWPSQQGLPGSQIPPPQSFTSTVTWGNPTASYTSPTGWPQPSKVGSNAVTYVNPQQRSAAVDQWIRTVMARGYTYQQAVQLYQQMIRPTATAESYYPQATALNAPAEQPEPKTGLSVWAYAGIGALLLAIGGAIGAWLGGRSSDPSSESPPQTITPQQAIEQIKALPQDQQLENLQTLLKPLQEEDLVYQETVDGKTVEHPVYCLERTVESEEDNSDQPKTATFRQKVLTFLRQPLKLPSKAQSVEQNSQTEKKKTNASKPTLPEYETVGYFIIKPNATGLPQFVHVADEDLTEKTEKEKHEKPRLLEVDTIVICAGQESVRDLVDELTVAGVVTHIIGGADVAGELDAKRAIEQGTRLAAKI